ncbi:uncharacterized protein BO72DRAFT_468737 [Aspergillus fijiensis CBS 313.89]|uniref:Uncharacterized protein n=1 Tax=Aspergillus fijiensis CBS 313.89 TaxID=1448319 RepID=A0A8G1W1L5_9EURO|nr:uncharacterized protein BO72DRAFT_468737 [Aspergillus fijiensis CBS 313.89]RAK77164.1 hypothetical protein BO72DRAFT_468737 [Aspergillus fijiensis CBS 313.89]
MARRKSALTPENYTRAIISLSRRYSSTSVFPGSNYVDLAEWMLQDRGVNPRPEEHATCLASTAEQTHDLVVVYGSSESKWGVQSYSCEQHETFCAAASVPAHGLGQMIFIRGFISPSWVSVLGSKYSIDPEFFRRHMDFLSASIDRHSYSFPSLSSSSENVYRLCVSTILHRDDFGGQDLQKQRAQELKELGIYKIQQLGSGRVRCGDSLVREYSTICPRFSVIEQWISLYVTKTERGWIAIAWMDQGRPLEESPPGPWTSHIEAKATPLPILQHHPKMAFRTTTNRLDPDANASAEIQQSTAILPLQYDSLIAMVNLARRAPQDPLSMCIPLFAHAAFSEVQFLNLLESKVQAQINAIADGVPADDALGVLHFFSNMLQRHAGQLKDSTRALYRLAERSSPDLTGMRSLSPLPTNAALSGRLGTGTTRRPSAESEGAKMAGGYGGNGAFAAAGLFEDYEELYVRCVDLSKMCTQGITLAMNKATIEESRKAIEQSERLKRLTLLATLFIPLSFSSSLLGMNIDLLGQNAVRFWWFFVLCVPITLFAYIVYLWDFQALVRCCVRLWKGCRGFVRDKTGERSKKEPGYMV